MRRQFLYMLTRLSGPFAVAALSLTAVVWLTQSLRFIDLIVNHGLSFATFLTLTALTMPSVLAIVLPVAVFVAVLYAYRRLIADSEIVALRATGSSNRRLAAPAAALGALVAIAVLAVNLWLMPAGYRAFKDRQHELRHSLASVLLREGVFDSPTEGLTVFARERDGGEMRGILLHDTRDPGGPVTVAARRGVLLEGPDGPRLMLEDGNRQQVERGADRPSFLFFESYAFDFAERPAALAARAREPSERYLHELLRPGAVPDRARREFAAEAHHRLISPLYAVVLALIAAAALLSGPFDRRRQVWRALAGAAAGGAFMAVALGLRNAIAGEAWPAASYGLAVAACAAVAAWPLAFEPGPRRRAPRRASARRRRVSARRRRVSAR